MPTPTRSSKRAAAFSFEEFYRAFGKSVPTDVALEDGEIRVVRANHSGARDSDRSSHRTVGEDSAATKTSLDLPLPAHIAALVTLQEADGSWKFSPEFAFVINGVAPAPMDGISSTTWATCICVCVWRQSPECFAQLEASYAKAMLHCDDGVLRRVQALIDFDALHLIRVYNDGEARRIRELLAKEAAAQRALEDAEYDRLTREREEIELITELSVENARRLPPKTQSVFITAVKTESRSVHLQFLDGDQERERDVPFSCLRRRPDDERAARDAGFEKLYKLWRDPVLCGDELARLEEIQAKKNRPKPWDSSRSQPILATLSELKTKTPLPDELYQDAVRALLSYDKAYLNVRRAVKSCSHMYATAILFKERFHAFDAFRDALVTLMRGTIEALEHIAAWKKYSASSKSSRSAAREALVFVWNGSNFVLTLSRSLDFLATNRELIEWYGDEFPLELNPFMLSTSLVDRAEDMGLVLATTRGSSTYSLHDALRLHKKDLGEAAAAPTWWPETHYDDELLARIARAETFVVREMRAAGVFALSEQR